MSVKIRLKRMGKIRAPYYRIVVADSRTKRDGRAIEEIGKYHPIQEPSHIEVDSARAQYWLGVGAQPTEQVLAILKVTGDWQKFKGEPGAEGTLRTATPKADKKAVFEAAAREGLGDTAAEGATTPRGGGRARGGQAPAQARPAAAPAEQTPAASAEQPAAPAEQVAAHAEQPAAPAEQAAPSVEQPAAPAEQVAPVAEQPAAPAEQAAPPAEQPAESAEQTAQSAAPASTGEAAADQAPTDQPTDQPADAADEGAPGGSETSAQVEGASETAQAEG